jgi:hypothetical protein
VLSSSSESLRNAEEVAYSELLADLLRKSDPAILVAVAVRLNTLNVLIVALDSAAARVCAWIGRTSRLTAVTGTDRRLVGAARLYGRWVVRE